MSRLMNPLSAAPFGPRAPGPVRTARREARPEERSEGGCIPVRAGTDDLVMALGAALVDPKLGGVILTGAPGAGKSVWLEACRRRAEEVALPPRDLPPGVTEDRLLGGLDLAATMTAGRPLFAGGLLAQADGGTLVAHALGRLPAWALRAVGTALRHGELRVERDGLSRTRATRFLLLGARLPDERLPAALTDAVTFHVALGGVRGAPQHTGGPIGNGRGNRRPHPVDLRASIFAAGGAARRLAEMLPDDEAIESARARLAALRTPDDAIAALCRAAAARGVSGHRSEWLAARAAAARAALLGRSVVEASDTEWAVAMVIESRPERSRESGSGPNTGGARAAGEQVQRDGGAAKATTPEAVRRSRPTAAGETAGSENAKGRPDASGDGVGREGEARPGQPDRLTHPAGETVPVPLAPAAARALRVLERIERVRRGVVSTPSPPVRPGPLASTGARRLAHPPDRERVSSRTQSSDLRRGAYEGIGPGDPRRRPIAVAATLRAAVPLQPVRRAAAARDAPTGKAPRGALPAEGIRSAPPTEADRDAHPREGAGAPAARRSSFRTGAPLLLRPEDLRVRRYAPQRSKLFVVAVDGSGSVGRRRLSEGKGIALRLAERAYVRRHRVALLVFQGTGATLLVPPARSRPALARAQIDRLAVGGGTPLAAAFRLVHRLWRSERRRSDVELLLMTDGFANVGQGEGGDGAPHREAVAWCAQLARAGLRSTVIDTSPPSRRGAPRAAEQWAERLGAAYVPMARLHSAGRADP